MANLVTPNFMVPDIAGAVTSGLQTGRNFAAQRQQDRDRAQLRNLAPGIVAGDNAAFDQAAAIDPTVAAAYQASGDSQVRRMKGAIDFMDQAIATNNPAAAESAYQQVKPFLSRFGQEPPATWAEAEPKFQQAKLQLAAAQQSGSANGDTVQSVQKDADGNLVAVMRMGGTRILGKADPGAVGQTLTIDVGGVPTQFTFDKRTQTYTPAMVGGQSSATQQIPAGGSQAVLDQEAALGNQLIAAGVPAQTVDAILQQRAQQSIATTQAVAPAMAPLTGRRKEDEAAAVAYASEAAKNAAGNANFGNELSQAQELERVKNQAALDRAQAEAQMKIANERSQAVATRLRDATESLGLIDEAMPLLDKATGSSVGAAYDASNAFFGRATEGAKANADLKVISAGLVQKVPRFEGPQSDRDVESYKEAAGSLGNPELPTETRKSAARTIIRLNQKYIDQQANSQSSGGAAGQGSSGLPRVTNEADYNALPSGATFLDPQGNQRRKR